MSTNLNNQPTNTIPLHTDTEPTETSNKSVPNIDYSKPLSEQTEPFNIPTKGNEYIITSYASDENTKYKLGKLLGHTIHRLFTKQGKISSFCNLRLFFENYIVLSIIDVFGTAECPKSINGFLEVENSYQSPVKMTILPNLIKRIYIFNKETDDKLKYYNHNNNFNLNPPSIYEYYLQDFKEKNYDEEPYKKFKQFSQNGGVSHKYIKKSKKNKNKNNNKSKNKSKKYKKL